MAGPGGPSGGAVGAVPSDDSWLGPGVSPGDGPIAATGPNEEPAMPGGLPVKPATPPGGIHRCEVASVTATTAMPPATRSAPRRSTRNVGRRIRRRPRRAPPTSGVEAEAPATAAAVPSSGWSSNATTAGRFGPAADAAAAGTPIGMAGGCWAAGPPVRASSSMASIPKTRRIASRAISASPGSSLDIPCAAPDRRRATRTITPPPTRAVATAIAMMIGRPIGSQNP